MRHLRNRAFREELLKRPRRSKGLLTQRALRKTSEKSRLLTQKNRKGDVSIILLVFMCLFVLFFALFTFVINGKKTSELIGDARALDGVYIDEEKADAYVRESLERAVIREYYDSLEDMTLEIEKVNGYFVGNVNGINSDSEIFNRTRENVRRGLFSISIEKEELKGNFGEVKITKDESVRIKPKILGFIPNPFAKDKLVLLIGVVYDAKIEVESDLYKIGLNSFEEINEAYDKCVSEEIESCMEEELIYFDVEVIDESAKIVELKSKRSFLIDNELKKMEMIIP